MGGKGAPVVKGLNRGRNGIRYRTRIWSFFAIVGGFLAILLLTSGWLSDSPALKYGLIAGALLVTFGICRLLANGLVRLKELDDRVFRRRSREGRVDND